MLGYLSRLFRFNRRSKDRPSQHALPRTSARYDAAGTGSENRKHWAGADALSPNAAANAADRKTLRERARYEVANNAFAFGAANSAAEDAIGTGPRLQLLSIDDPKAREAVESSWARWADEVGLADSLRLLYRAGVVDGEAFALLTDNPALAHPVTLDVRVIEADRVTDPTIATSSRLVDGIDYDSAGNPTRYTVLRQHPGDSTGLGGGLPEYDLVPAAQVYHWFRADRPGQARGVSWLTPALPLFAILRRYTLATLGAAELGANLAGILKSNLPPGDDEAPPSIEAMDEVEIPRGALVTLPPGWEMDQFDAKQPQQQFGEFRTQILVEIARVLDMPLNRITGNSSGYNYSSGRLDHLSYHAGVWRHRDRLRLRVLDRLFRAWLDQAAVTPGGLPDGLPPFAEWSWDWQWDAFGDIDPVKEAQAAQALLDAHLTDYAEQCAARGRRWDQVFRQRARERELAAELGLDLTPQPAAGTQPQQQPADPADLADQGVTSD